MTSLTAIASRLNGAQRGQPHLRMTFEDLGPNLGEMSIFRERQKGLMKSRTPTVPKLTLLEPGAAQRCLPPHTPPSRARRIGARTSTKTQGLHALSGFGVRRGRRHS